MGEIWDFPWQTLTCSGKNGGVRLGDFGLAIEMEQANPHSFSGTPNYLAPEVEHFGFIFHFGFPKNEKKNPQKYDKCVLHLAFLNDEVLLMIWW